MHARLSIREGGLIDGKACTIRKPPGCVRSRRQSVIITAAGSTFGHSFRVTTFGESHGGGVGCVVDGVPPRLRISKVGFQ